MKSEMNLFVGEFICGPDGDSDGGEFDDNQIYDLRKTMLVPKNEEENQRHHFFWTRCTINGSIFIQ